MVHNMYMIAVLLVVYRLSTATEPFGNLSVAGVTCLCNILVGLTDRNYRI